MIKKKRHFYVAGLTFLLTLSSAGVFYLMDNVQNSILMAEPSSFAIAFGNTTKELREQEMHIKTLLAYSNATTKLVGMEELTIGEGLLKLAQLNNQLRTIESYKTRKQIVKNVKHATFEGDKDRVYVTEYLYDPAQVDADIKSLQREISRLQVAIDRTNLTNMIEC